MDAFWRVELELDLGGVIRTGVHVADLELALLLALGVLKRAESLVDILLEDFDVRLFLAVLAPVLLGLLHVLFQLFGAGHFDGLRNAVQGDGQIGVAEVFRGVDRLLEGTGVLHLNALDSAAGLEAQNVLDILAGAADIEVVSAAGHVHEADRPVAGPGLEHFAGLLGLAAAGGDGQVFQLLVDMGRHLAGVLKGVHLAEVDA